MFTTSFLALNILIFITGIGALLKGSDYFVDGAVVIARKLKVSELAIGLTLVSIGTSLPEMGTNIYAAIEKQSDITMGNIVGSNLCNVLFILALSVVIMGVIPVGRDILKRDMPFMVGSTLLVMSGAYFFGKLNFLWGIASFVVLGFYMWMLFRNSKGGAAASDESESSRIKSVPVALLVMALSVALITLGAKAMVDNAVWFSTQMGLNASVIAVTVVAIGTSLPELAVTLVGVIKKKNDIALGNIIGSNIMNVLLILGLSSLISPVMCGGEMLEFYLPALLVSDLMLIGFVFWGGKLNRIEGVLMLTEFAAFMIYNVIKL